MFDPMHQPTTRAEWQIDPLVRSVDSSRLPYDTVDWATVPKVDYARTRFRQLAKPESAKVFDDSTGFVLETFGVKPAVQTVDESPSESLAQPEPAEDVEDTATQEVTEPLEELSASESEVAEPSEALLSGDDPDDDIDSNTMEALPEPAIDTEPSEPEAPVIDEALLAQLKEEAFAQGLAQGLQEGLAQGREQAENEYREAAQQAELAAQQALEQALAEQRETLEARLQPELDLLRDMTQRLEALTENPRQFFEPLKRLSLHLAEQLVLGELTISGAAIERLVQRCLDELDLHGKSMVVVELNPQDKARIGEKAAELLDGLQLQSVSSLAPGSAPNRPGTS